MPTIKSFLTSDANFVRGLFNNTAFLLGELSDGRIALADRTQSGYVVLDEIPSRDELRMYAELFAQYKTHEASGRFYGEPDIRTLARDMRAANAPPRIHRAPRTDLAVDIDL